MVWGARQGWLLLCPQLSVERKDESCMGRFQKPLSEGRTAPPRKRERCDLSEANGAKLLMAKEPRWWGQNGMTERGQVKVWENLRRLGYEKESKLGIFSRVSFDQGLNIPRTLENCESRKFCPSLRHVTAGWNQWVLWNVRWCFRRVTLINPFPVFLLHLGLLWGPHELLSLWKTWHISQHGLHCQRTL